MFLLPKTFLSVSHHYHMPNPHSLHRKVTSIMRGKPPQLLASLILKEVDSLLCLADQSKLIHKHIQDVQQGPGCSGIQPT